MHDAAGSALDQILGQDLIDPLSAVHTAMAIMERVDDYVRLRQAGADVRFVRADLLKALLSLATRAGTEDGQAGLSASMDWRGLAGPPARGNL